MKREEFITERTRIISEMLDNPDKYGIYPTTKCFEQLDALFDSLSLPPAEGAEEYLRKHPFLLGETEDGEDYLSSDDIELIKQLAPMLEEFATLHAQKIADKMVEDMRKKLFSMRASKETMDMLSEADRLITYGYHDCINEMLMWTKSKKI